MSRALRLVLFCSAAAVLACAALVAAVLVWGLPEHWLSLHIDGDNIVVGHGHVGHWLLATAGVLIATVVTLLVVPIVLVFSVGVPLLGVALMLSPLILLVWLIFRRPSNTRNTKGPPPAATIGT